MENKKNMKTIELLKKRLEEIKPINRTEEVLKQYLLGMTEDDYFKDDDALDICYNIINETHEGAFPDWTMDELIGFISKVPLYKDMMAAKLYLESWQMDECPNHPLDRNYIGEQKVQENAKRKETIDKMLLEEGYASSKTTFYDNEGCPIIQWRDPEFDCETFYMEILEEE